MNDYLKLFAVRDCPTVIDGKHESLTRSFQILRRVKYLLKEGVPQKVILEIIDELESFEQNEYSAKQTN